jgi:DNA-binding transcriptional regulator GbsR (MarR family)
MRIVATGRGHVYCACSEGLMSDIGGPESAFVEQLGLIYQTEGMPRIAGRIIGLMLLDARPYSFDELAKALKISRGSVSTNTRALEAWGVLNRVSMPGERQDYFKLSKRPYSQMLERQLEKTRRLREQITNARDQIPEDHAIARARVSELIRFYDVVVETTETGLAQFGENVRKLG